MFDILGLIVFCDLDKLILLESMSNVKDENGDCKIYCVVNDVVNVFKVCNVKFVGKFLVVQ